MKLAEQARYGQLRADLNEKLGGQGLHSKGTLGPRDGRILRSLNTDVAFGLGFHVEPRHGAA